MSKNTALDLALDLFKSKGTVTPAEINKHVGKGNYASKYVLYLKLAGHDISTNKQGRTVVDYTYNGINPNVDTSVKAADRRASQLTGASKSAKVSKPAAVKTTKTAAPKKTTVTKTEPKTDGKPVMTKEEIKKATAAILALREKDAKKAVEKVAAAPVVASSFTVDPDWDSADGLSVRELGL